MIITTTPSIEGHPIREYLGVISAETIIGANVFRDLAANIRDFFGGRSSSYENVLRKGKETAINELRINAESRGATAIVGVSLSYEAIGGNGSMLMVVATGTAVTI